jgi:hypothetical protein
MNVEAPPVERWHDQPGYPHQPDWSSLVTSADTCPLCRLIREIGGTDCVLEQKRPRPDLEEPPTSRLKLRAFRPNQSETDLAVDQKGVSSVAVSNGQSYGSLYLDILAEQGQWASPIYLLL